MITTVGQRGEDSFVPIRASSRLARSGAAPERVRNREFCRFHSTVRYGSYAASANMAIEKASVGAWRNRSLLATYLAALHRDLDEAGLCRILRSQVQCNRRVRHARPARQCGRRDTSPRLKCKGRPEKDELIQRNRAPSAREMCTACLSQPAYPDLFTHMASWRAPPPARSCDRSPASRRGRSPVSGCSRS